MCLNVKLLFYIIVIVTCVNHPRVNGSEIRFSDVNKCNRNFRTRQYEYTEKFPIDEIRNENGIFLTFFVRGDRDAHIIFSPDDNPTRTGSTAYEIALGTSTNQEASIRIARTGSGKKTSTSDTSFRLRSSTWSEFWIRINWTSPGEEIQVGKGNEKAFLTWGSPTRMVIKHYGFSGWSDSNVEWLLPCPQKIKNAIELETEVFANYKQTPITLETANITLKSHSAVVNDSSLDINATINITWKDDKLRWNSSESDVKKLKVNFARVTKPTVVIHNFTLVGSGDVAISPDGIVTWEDNYPIKVESCLPKGDSPYRPLLKCPIGLGFLGKNITFIASNDASPNVPSLFFDLNETMISITANTTIDLKYIRRNIKRIKDPNREQIQMDLQKTDTKVSSTDGPASENPTTKNSVSENSVSENPATKNFVSENSVSENPTTKTPSTNPTSDNSTTKKPESKK